MDMRITFPNGMIAELSGVDEHSAVPTLSALSGAGISLSDPQPDEEESPSAVVEHVSDMVVSVNDGHRRTRVMIPNPPIPKSSWPNKFYITTSGLTVIEALRDHHPEGLDYEKLGAQLGVSASKASSRANGLRRISPLVALVAGRYQLTEIGQDRSLLLIETRLPSHKNRDLGWQRFVALTLSDGRQRQDRTSR